jgi:hypothetical protein
MCPQCSLGSLRALTLARAKNLQTEALLIYICSIYAELIVIDLCPTKWGIDVMPPSRNILDEVDMRSMCPSQKPHQIICSRLSVNFLVL